MIFSISGRQMIFEEQLQRIREIDEALLGENACDEHCELVNQFLRSAATLLEELNSEIQSPHFEPREVFVENQRLDRELKTELRSKFEKSFFSYQIVSRHLRLSRLSETNEDAIPYRSLYNPLITILEDGGLLDLDRGDIVIDGKWTSPTRNFRTRFVK
jgi:hypothetical protein